jgi:hypothetical protein
MAVRSLGDTARLVLDNCGPSARPSSVAEIIQIYHEDIPPLPPLKDTKYRNLSRKPLLLDTHRVYKANNMYSSATVYKCDKKNYPNRHDSLLDSPFGCYFHPKAQESLSPFVAYDRGSPETILDNCCSSSSSSSACSSVSQRQSLLPPFPQESLLSSLGILHRQSLCPPSQCPLPTTTSDQPKRMPAFEPSSKRSITPLELEQLRHAPLPARLDNHCRTPSTTSGLDLNHIDTIGTSSHLTSTSATFSTLESTMSSLTTSQPPSLSMTSGLGFSAPRSDSSTRQTRRKTHKPPSINQAGSIPSNLQRRDFSPPLDTQPNSPLGANFDFGLPSQDFVTRRQSHVPVTADASVSTPPLPSGCTTSLGTPTSQSSIQPLLTSFQDQSIETSAFDSDSDNEGRSSHAKTLYKKVSRPLLGPSRTRAEILPSAGTRSNAKGASISKRISKQDISAPALCSSHSSTDPDGCGITMVRLSTSSIASPTDTGPSGTTTAPATLRKILSNKEAATGNSKRTSDTSDTTEKSSTSTQTTNSRVGGGVPGRRRNTTSSERVRSWFSRVFTKRNTL